MKISMLLSVTSAITAGIAVLHTTANEIGISDNKEKIKAIHDEMVQIGEELDYRESAERNMLQRITALEEAMRHPETISSSTNATYQKAWPSTEEERKTPSETN